MVTIFGSPAWGTSPYAKQRIECNIVCRHIQNKMDSGETLEIIFKERDEAEHIRSQACHSFVSDCIFAKDSWKREGRRVTYRGTEKVYPGDFIAYENDEEVFADCFDEVMAKCKGMAQVFVIVCASPIRDIVRVGERFAPMGHAKSCLVSPVDYGG